MEEVIELEEDFIDDIGIGLDSTVAVPPSPSRAIETQFGWSGVPIRPTTTTTST